MKFPHIRAERGMTMIEVLISIVVFAFGLLGVAALIVVGIRNTYSSQQRSVATQLAYDIMDRARSNNVGANAGNYNKPVTSPTDSTYTTQKSACIGLSAVPTGCNAADLASNDLYEWKNALQAALGSSAIGVICLDSSSANGSFDGTTITPSCDGLGATYAVKIFWMDDRGQSQQATPQYQAFVTRFLP